jgi:hypothetical protein
MQVTNRQDLSNTYPLVLQPNSGNVGIGTTTPLNPLHIIGISSSNPGLKIESATADSMISIKNTSTGGREWWIGAGGNSAGAGPNFYIFDATVGGGTAAVRLTIDANGNVGIGSTSPGQKLSVNGTIESKAGGVKFPDGTTQTTAAPNIGLASCPSGFTMIGTSGKRGTYCIDTTERTASTWLTAKQTCFNLNLAEGAAMMCDHSEWYKACLAGTPTGMTGNWEWVDEIHYAGAEMAGSANCDSLNNANFTNSYVFRCCVR